MPKDRKTQEYIGKDLEAMSFAHNYNQWIIDLIKPYFGDTIAEVGAGTGNISKLLLENKLNELIAFEPSTNMHSELTRNLEKYNNAKSINDSFSNHHEKYREFFDTVIYINVLEHIEDDNKELLYVWNSLKHGGHICIFVPALNWLYCDFDKSIGHYRRYHKKEIIKQLESCNYEIISAKYIDMLGIVPWYIFFVLFKQTLTSSKTNLYDSMCIPPIRLLENIFPAPLGKNLLLIAKKLNK